MLVKKYSNRRLYDTKKSSYITLDELAVSIRAGADVQVVDAKSGADLTQQTLAQIVLESRGASKLLPVPLLMQMVRMGDDALAEFMGQTMSWSLQAYLQAKNQAQAFGGFAPFGSPFGSPSPFGDWHGAAPSQRAPQNQSADEAISRPPKSKMDKNDDKHVIQSDIEALRRELEELRSSLRPKEEAE